MFSIHIDGSCVSSLARCCKGIASPHPRIAIPWLAMTGVDGVVIHRPPAADAIYAPRNVRHCEERALALRARATKQSPCDEKQTLEICGVELWNGGQAGCCSSSVHDYSASAYEWPAANTRRASLRGAGVGIARKGDEAIPMQ